MDSKDNQNLVYKLPNEMFQPSAIKKLDGCFFVKNIDGQFDNYVFDEGINYDITITNTGDAFLLTGSASGKAITSCSRCLEDVEIDINANIDAYYLIEVKEDEEDIDISEFDILPDDHIILLGDIIKASILVDAPLKPLCDENCKGLCPKCGVNLNKQSCSCKDEIDSSHPFSALKNYKI